MKKYKLDKDSQLPYQPTATEILKQSEKHMYELLVDLMMGPRPIDNPILFFAE